MQKQRNVNVEVRKIYAVILKRWFHGENFAVSLTKIPAYLVMNIGIRLL